MATEISYLRFVILLICLSPGWSVGQELLYDTPYRAFSDFCDASLWEEVGYTKAERKELVELEADWNAPWMEAFLNSHHLERTEAILVAREIQHKIAANMLKAVENIAPEKYPLAIQSLNRRFLTYENRGQHIGRDPSFLLATTSGKLLEITDQQKKKIGKLRKEFDKGLDSMEREFRQAAVAVWKRHYKRICNGLDRESHKKFERLIGEPAFELRAFDTPFAKLAGLEVLPSSEDPLKSWEQNEFVFPESTTDDPAIGLTNVLLELLFSKLLQERIDLSPPRRAEFVDLVPQVPLLRNDSYVRDDPKMVRALLDERAKLPKPVEAFFTEDERKKTLELELQLRMKNWNSFGLEEPRMSKAVDLSAEETAQIHQDIERLKDDLDALHKTWAAKGEILIAGYRAEAMAVLSEEQRQRFVSLVGAD